MHKNHVPYLLAFLLYGCYEKTDSPEQLKIVSEITAQAQKPIDFKNITNDKWSRVCFFGPYTLKSNDVLGFDWDVTKKTAVAGDDTINVIVFATEKQVTEFVVVPRGKADFWKLSRQCFPRNNARFIYDGSVWSYLHKNA
jgi:hypothetical protein